MNEMDEMAEYIRREIRKISTSRDVLSAVPLDNQPAICVFLGEDAEKLFYADVSEFMEDTLQAPPTKDSIKYHTLKTFDDASEINTLFQTSLDSFRQIFTGNTKYINLFFISCTHGEIWKNEGFEALINTVKKIRDMLQQRAIILKVRHMLVFDINRWGENKFGINAKKFGYSAVTKLGAKVYHIPTRVTDMDYDPISKTIAFLVLLLCTDETLSGETTEATASNGENYPWTTARLFEVDYFATAVYHIARKMLEEQSEPEDRISPVDSPDIYRLVEETFKSYDTAFSPDDVRYMPIKVEKVTENPNPSFLKKIFKKNDATVDSYTSRGACGHEIVQKIIQDKIEQLDNQNNHMLSGEFLDEFIMRIIRGCSRLYQLNKIEDYITSAKKNYNETDNELTYINMTKRIICEKKKDFLDRVKRRFVDNREFYEKKIRGMSNELIGILKRLSPSTSLDKVFNEFPKRTINLGCTKEMFIDNIRGLERELREYVLQPTVYQGIKQQYDGDVTNSSKLSDVRCFGAHEITHADNQNYIWYVGTDTGGISQGTEKSDPSKFRASVGQFLFTHDVPAECCKELPF